MIKFLALMLLMTFQSCGTLEEKHVPKELSLVVKEEGLPKKVTVPLEFHDGIAIIFSSAIVERLHAPVKERNPFSYLSPRKIEIEILDCDSLNGIVFSSFKKAGCLLQEKDITNFVIGMLTQRSGRLISLFPRAQHFL